MSDELTTKPGVDRKPLSEEEWRLGVERRLHALDLNVALAVNYCREMAKVHLSAEAIHAIESSLSNGHSSDVPEPG